MFTAVLDQQKIAMGRVRQAYVLNVYEVNDLTQVLRPNAVFPLKLWQRTHELFWKDFALAAAIRYKVECPVLPDLVLEPGKYFNADLCGFDVMAFFRKLSLLIDSKIAKMGLDYILAETFDNFETIYEERTFLFSTLQKLEQRGPGYNMFATENIDDELLCLPASSYHFISHIFADTVLVDKVTVIRLLRNYPLRQEVKGITHDFVAFVLKAFPEELPATHSSADQTHVQVPASPSTGSRKGHERIQATRQACEEVVKELYREKQVIGHSGGKDSFLITVRPTGRPS